MWSKVNDSYYMTDKQVLFVCATPDDKQTFERTSTLWKSIHNRPELNYKIHFSNTVGLSQLYNRTIDDVGSLYDYVVFVHDDLSIEDSLVVKKLKVAHQHYDIVGLAGGKNIDANFQAPLWHIMTKQKHGAVAHPTEKDGSLTVAAFGSTPAECDLIDGLFISVNVKKVKEGGVRFNEDMSFHFYDLAFCMNARNAGLKIGVWPIWTVHQGLGDSYDSTAWRECAMKFVRQYYPARL